MLRKCDCSHGHKEKNNNKGKWKAEKDTQINIDWNRNECRGKRAFALGCKRNSEGEGVWSTRQLWTIEKAIKRVGNS